jgi:hypothetical protein
MRIGLVAGLVAAGCALAPSPASALGLGVSTPSVTMANFGPGFTATGSGVLVVSGVLTPWTLKAADTTGNAGHPASSGVACTGSEARTVDPLTATAAGVLGTTSSAGALTIGASQATVATGVAPDTVTVNYSLAIGKTELMRTGCLFSTTITYTVQ